MNLIKVISVVIVIFFSTFNLKGQDHKVKIVVLGSSTAAGGGVTFTSNSWVNRYRAYLQSINPENEVINLAQGGFKIYQIMPTGFVPPWGSVNTSKNITKGLSYDPDAIIINLPSNDAVAGVPVNEQITNYYKILDLADTQNVPVWITTTQPRNLNQTGLKSLIDMKDSTISHFADKAIDFWTSFANEDGTVNPTYDSGDHTHLNDEAHGIMFQRVVKAGIHGYITNKYLQAEDYSEAENVETETEYLRNSNRGYIRIRKNTNASVSFKLKAENTTSLDIFFRHSNQNKTGVGKLYVNDVPQYGQLNFFPTKSEQAWNNVVSEIELLEGENTVELEFANQEEDILLDFIAWDNSLVTHDHITATNLFSQKEEEIKAYPVPFNDELNLIKATKQNSIAIYSSTGIKMYETQSTGGQLTINTSGFPTGLYFIHVFGNEGDSKILKVLKK